MFLRNRFANASSSPTTGRVFVPGLSDAIWNDRNNLVSRFPIPDSRFPIPDSRFPIPDSRFYLFASI
ncbi:MAG: hypothetical protein F6J90_08440 [Moorea sp. SIOASIH]|uniref:hypothetical protein n=1 Tax=Moorena sp. SIOASIH TaxID=2607817 RepID=UPI0013B7F152|nr:hypothetical protein [Moorena sp. SIOASIH]NEO36344.1 hypothetical protein [Moorena sp. SIOASIH]